MREAFYATFVAILFGGCVLIVLAVQFSTMIGTVLRVLR